MNGVVHDEIAGHQDTAVHLNRNGHLWKTLTLHYKYVVVTRPLLIHHTMFSVNFRLRSLVKFEQYYFPSRLISVADLQTAVFARHKLSHEETRLLFVNARTGANLVAVAPNADVIGIRLPGRKRRRRRQRQPQVLSTADDDNFAFLHDFCLLSEAAKLSVVGKCMP